jgi:hypothetical protein
MWGRTSSEIPDENIVVCHTKESRSKRKVSCKKSRNEGGSLLTKSLKMDSTSKQALKSNEQLEMTFKKKLSSLLMEKESHRFLLQVGH